MKSSVTTRIFPTCLSKKLMQICEIFFSLQGESSYAGLPCIFIRLAGCNLTCNYCDTAYSREPGRDYCLDEILREIGKHDCKLVEITGGEPLLQQEVLELMEHLEKHNYTVLLETNGTQSIQNVPNFVHVIIDVKLEGSGHSGSFMEANLQWLRQGWDEIKFVVSDETDFGAAISFLKQHRLSGHTILFSPVWEKLQLPQLADWIKQTGMPLRLNLQLHKVIWDKQQRGV